MAVRSSGLAASSIALAGLALAVTMGASPVRAQDTLRQEAVPQDRAPQDRLRVVVWMSEGGDEKVLMRLLGQTSDLPVTLVPVRETADATIATAAGQLAAANDAARRENADAVIWFSVGSCASGDIGNRGGAVVHIGQPRARSVLSRVIGESRCDSSAAASTRTEIASASLEMIAIVVRNALVAIAEGGTIGVVAPSPPPAPRRSPSPPPSSTRARLATGWLFVVDGLAPRAHQGLAASVGIDGARFGVELAASATLPVAITDEVTTVALSRMTVALGAVASAPLGARVVGSAALHAGAMVQNRTTTARGVDVVAYPNSRHVSAIASAEVRLSWMVPGLRGLAAVVGAAGDYVPAAPIIVYERELQLVQPRRPWVVQPRITVGFELRLP